MPTLRLSTNVPLNPAQTQAVAQGLTAVSTEVLGKRAGVTAVLVEVLPAGRWFIGGVAPRGPTARLEIQVTAGTNTAEEKAAFVAAAQAELARQLGPLEEASYVLVHELPAGDWGYGGRTQQARRLTQTVL